MHPPIPNGLSYDTILSLGHTYNHRVQHILIYNWYMICTHCKDKISTDIKDVSDRLNFSYNHLNCKAPEQ